MIKYLSRTLEKKQIAEIRLFKTMLINLNINITYKMITKENDKNFNRLDY